MTGTIRMWMSLGVFTVGCGGLDDGRQRIDVARNGLGISVLEIDHARGDKAFELRALGPDANEVARVRMRIGTIPDLASGRPGTDVGSEITMTAGSAELRIVSREVNVHVLPPISQPTLHNFIDLPEAASALEHEANTFVARRRNDETAFTTFSCNDTDLLVTPIAEQCCESTGDFGGTLFYDGSGHTVSRMGPRTPCTAFNGGSCSGRDCYFGPLGFSKPSTYTTNQNDVIYTSFAGNCVSDQNGYPEFDNVIGSAATGQGCPGGADSTYEWDY